MKFDEVRERYKIPLEILQHYTSFAVDAEAKSQTCDAEYDEKDIQLLSMIMTLHGVGFSAAEIDGYMRLWLEGEITGGARVKMLEQRRSILLEEIHFKEKQLADVDYLRHELQGCGEQLI